MADTLQTLKRLGLIKLLLLAILLRLLLMPFYLHPDIKTYHFQASFLKQGVWDIYSYLSDNKDKLPLKEEFVYFPLTYIFLGSYQILMSPFLGADFVNWLHDASQQANERIGIFRYLFILKLPYLLIDIAIAFVLMRLFTNPADMKKALIFWLFNPFSLAIIYIFSNVDIIPVLLSLVSLLLFKNKRFLLSGFTLALATGFKAYPILFLPFLLIFIKDFKKRLLMVSITLGTVGAIIAPFWSKAFLNSALVSSLTTRLAFPGIGIGFGEALMVGIVLLSILFFTLVISTNRNTEDIWYYLLAVLLIIFSSIHFHIQWLLWIIPYLVIYYIYHKDKDSVKLVWVWIALASIIPLLYDDRSMTISLLSTLSPLYNLIPTPFLLLQHFYDPFLTQGVIHSVIFGISLMLLWRILKVLKI